MAFFWCVCRAIRRQPRAYMGLLWSEAAALSIVFSYATLFFHPQLRVVKEGAESIFNFIFLVPVASVFVPIYYSLVTLYRTRQKQLGVFLLLGMNPRYLWIMLLLETVIVGCGAVVLGTLVGGMLSPGLLFFAEQALGLVELPFYFSWKALVSSVAVSFLLLVLASVLTPLLIQRKRVIQLLQSERRLDSLPKPPIINLLYSVAAVFSLGSLVFIGFFLPAAVIFDWGVYAYYAIVALSALGVYSSYRQGSLVLFRLCRWNKNFSWKGTRLLWLGNMAHRFHDNARFFYNLSILITGVLFFSIISIALIQSPIGEIVKNIKGSSQKIGPALVYRLGKEGETNPDEEGSLESINQQLLNNGLVRVDSHPLMIGDLVESKSEYLSIRDEQRWALQENIQAELTRYTRGWFLSLKDYNEMLKALGKTALSLDPNEAAVLCEKENCSDEEIPLNPIPEQFGVRKVHYLSPRGLLVPLQKTQYAPQWILGNQVYARALQYPNMQKFWDVNYLLPRNEMNPRIFKALVEAGSVDPKNQIWDRIMAGREVPPSFIYSEMADTHQITVFLIFYFFSLFLTCPISLIGIMNMLFLRICDDVENQRRQFQNLLRIGVPMHHLQRSTGIQVALLFFIPVFVSGVLAIYWVHCVARVLRNQLPAQMGLGDALFSSTGWTFLLFLVLQVAVFGPTCSWVLRAMKKG